MKIIDLSATIETSIPGIAPGQFTTVEHFDHAHGARMIEEQFGVTAELLRDGEGWATERVTIGTHNSTHVDAPYHYNSRIQGRPAQTIDELPLERFYGPGVVLDFHERDDGEAIGAADVQDALQRAGHELAAGDIVLIRSDCDRYYGRLDYTEHGPGVTREATQWLFDRGIRVMGIDAWGWDRPLSMQAAEARERQATGIFWEAHQADLPYSQIERLANLATLPPTGFQVACFPLKIARASAAPARVVAIVL